MQNNRGVMMEESPRGRAVSLGGAAPGETSLHYEPRKAGDAQLSNFAEHTTSLIWIGDVAADIVLYLSTAFERIWGLPRAHAPSVLSELMRHVHPDDRKQVEHSLAMVRAGEVVRFGYRIVRPGDGAIRWLRDTAFPILDENGVVTQIGGIAEDLTPEEIKRVYVVSPNPLEARRLALLVRRLGFQARPFDGAAAFLDKAPVLATGCVLVDIRAAGEEGLTIPRELKARSIPLPSVVLAAPSSEVASAVDAMKAGAADYLVAAESDALSAKLARVIAECHSIMPQITRDEGASARVARLTPREREVLIGLVEGGTNKSIGRRLGISPRTVELHRAQVMNRLDAGSLTELLQTALAAGVNP